MADQQQTLSLQKALDLAVQHHNSGRLRQAEIIYQQILQSDPNQADALHLLGVIAHQVGKNDVAVDLITKALTIKPELAEAHSNLGLALQDLSKLEEAIGSHQKAIALKPDYAEAHYNLGLARHALGKPGDASASYRKALTLKPDYAEAHNSLGTALHDLGKLEEAVASYSTVLTLKPDFAEAHYNLGFTLQAIGKLEEAVASYRKAIDLKPDFAEAHNNLGTALRGLRKFTDAVSSCRKAIALKPDYAEAHNNLGIAFQDLDKLEEAVSSYQKAFALKPDFATAHYNLGTVLQKFGKLEDALQVFESVDTPECYAHVLECLFALGEYDKFYVMQRTSAWRNENNIRAAAISAFASHQLNRRDPHPFCPTPLDFVQVYENLDGVDDADGFLHDLMDNLQSREAVWEPPGNATRQGFQTSPNLFHNPNGQLADLDRIVKEAIEKYRLEFSSEDCGFIKLFPKTSTLNGWFVRLLKGGHQTEHIHPGGWLSGVFYLQVPKCTNREEGSIELGLWGYDYPILNKSYPKKRFYPKSGDIIVFPSSLFHRTIPFHSDKERMSIAFDLRPTQT